MNLSSILYYGSAIPIAIGVFMAYRAGQIEKRKEQEAETWRDADNSPMGSMDDVRGKHNREHSSSDSA